MHYPFILPALPYTYESLEPHIDALTMRIHHTKHHQAYIDNLNKALEPYPQLHSHSLTDLLTHLDALPAEIKTVVRNNAGGHSNHSLFWTLMTPGGTQLQGDLKDALLKTFGSFEQFQTQFNDAAKKVFGSGWAWLCLTAQNQLQIITTANQDAPCMTGLQPILGLDVWEHAYYLQYQNRRPDYISAWWNVIDWNAVSALYKQHLG